MTGVVGELPLNEVRTYASPGANRALVNAPSVGYGTTEENRW